MLMEKISRESDQFDALKAQVEALAKSNAKLILTVGELTSELDYALRRLNQIGDCLSDLKFVHFANVISSYKD